MNGSEPLLCGLAFKGASMNSFSHNPAGMDVGRVIPPDSKPRVEPMPIGDSELFIGKLERLMVLLYGEDSAVWLDITTPIGIERSTPE